MTRDEMRREIQKLGDAAVARARALGATQASFRLVDEVDGRPVELAFWRFKVRKAPGLMHSKSWWDVPRLLEELPADLERCFTGPPFVTAEVPPAPRPPAE